MILLNVAEVGVHCTRMVTSEEIDLLDTMVKKQCVMINFH